MAAQYMDNAKYEVLFPHLPPGTKEIHKNLHHL